MFLLALPFHTASLHSQQSTCAWTWSTVRLYMLNNISCVDKELLPWNGTVWGEHTQNCVHSDMKGVEIPQPTPVELLCIKFTLDCFDGRCTRNISKVTSMHVSVFANIYHRSTTDRNNLALCTFCKDESVLQHKENFSPNSNTELTKVICTVHGILSHRLLVSCHPCFLFALGKNYSHSIIIRSCNCFIRVEKF